MAAPLPSARRWVIMSSQPVVFNHVGLCVRERLASRRFYGGLLGFEFWWELDAPDEGTDVLLRLERPVGLHATYLVRDGLVLELLDYSGRAVHGGWERVMDQVGLRQTRPPSGHRQPQAPPASHQWSAVFPHRHSPRRAR